MQEIVSNYLYSLLTNNYESGPIIASIDHMVKYFQMENNYSNNLFSLGIGYYY